jgi:hypothetical protein
VNSFGRLVLGDCWSDGIRSCVPICFVSVGSDVKFCYLLLLWDTYCWFYGEVKGREWEGGRVLSTSAGGSRLCVDGGLAWCFVLHSSDMRVGASTHEKFNALSFMVKIQDLTLNGCV